MITSLLRVLHWDKERKLHVQTLAAMYPEADSYEELLMTCRKMRLPESPQNGISRRLVFDYLANIGHTLNTNLIAWGLADAGSGLSSPKA